MAAHMCCGTAGAAHMHDLRRHGDSRCRPLEADGRLGIVAVLRARDNQEANGVARLPQAVGLQQLANVVQLRRAGLLSRQQRPLAPLPALGRLRKWRSQGEGVKYAHLKAQCRNSVPHVADSMCHAHMCALTRCSAGVMRQLQLDASVGVHGFEHCQGFCGGQGGRKMQMVRRGGPPRQGRAGQDRAGQGRTGQGRAGQGPWSIFHSSRRPVEAQDAAAKLTGSGSAEQSHWGVKGLQAPPPPPPPLHSGGCSSERKVVGRVVLQPGCSAG